MYLNNEDKKIYQELIKKYNISYEYASKKYYLPSYPVEYSYYLAIKYIEKYYHSNDDIAYNLEDYFIECIIAINKAFKEYKTNVNFIQYIERQITNHLKKVFKTTSITPTESLDNKNNEYIIEDYPYTITRDKELKDYIYNWVFNTNFYVKKYLRTERNLNILKMYFNFEPYSNISVKDIAEKYNISTSRVHNIITEICKIFLREINIKNIKETGNCIYHLEKKDKVLTSTLTNDGKKYYEEHYTFNKTNPIKILKK